MTIFLATPNGPAKQTVIAKADTPWSESHALLVQAAAAVGSEKVRLQLAEPPKTK